MAAADRAGAVLEVDLGAIVANWRLLCGLHRTGPVAGVVKADGYGLGAQHVAPALYAAGCRYFFVALLDEALAIRALVPDAMVAVLGGLTPGSEADYLAHDIVPVLGSLAEIDAWGAQAHRLERKLPAIVHVDTGMSRLGLDARELAVLQQDHARLAPFDLRYVLTHLVSSEAAHDPLNEHQRIRFAAACAGLPAAPRSFANSSGIFLGEGWGSDLARPGAALYGINPIPPRPNPMRQPVRLRARVLAVRDVHPGEGVGYNATWHAARISRIATAAIGYADGLHRTLSNNGRAFFDGTPVPLVGRVSMDLTTFDVTGAAGVLPGAWLDIIGPMQTPDDLAVAAGTNGYEVLTSLGHRFHRIYTPA
jgi:alanine racemase